MPDVTFSLNVFDANGEMTGETRDVTLSVEAAADIIDHAHQAAVLKLATNSTDEDMEIVMDELIEALSTYDVLLEGSMDHLPR